MKNSYQQAYQAIKSTTIVSFDIFDTLLLRRVLQPVDVFRRMELELGSSCKGFREWRVAAESDARRQAPHSYSGEVNLEEIYEVLCQSNESLAGRQAELMAHEIRVEKEVTMVHPLGRALFEHACDLGCRIVLLSDMYLPESVILALLRDHGYEAEFDLYLSNKLRQSKSQGALYTTLISQLHCRPSQIVHIGDNYHSDYKMARKAGLQAVHLPKLADTLKVDTSDRPLSESILEAMSLRRFAEDLLVPKHSRDYWQRVGEEVAAPLYLGFISDLIEQTKSLGIRRLFFCSRDGKIMKAVYDRLTAGQPEYPISEYFLASRRASKVASFVKLGEHELNFLVDTGLALTVRDYLNRIHIEPEAVLDVVLSVGFESLEHSPQSADERQRLRDLFIALEPQILAVAADERSAYLAYMESLGVMEEDLWALVDVGWNATIFGAMTKLVRMRKPACSTHGFFFGTFEWAYLNQHDNSSLSGYYFEDCKPDENYHALKHSIAICEILFSAEEDSLLRFKNERGQWVPEFDLEAASIEYSEAVRSIQTSALAVVSEYKRGSGALHLGVNQSYATKAFVRLLTRPTVEEARHWGDLPFWPEFGHQVRDHFLARPSSLFQYLIKPYFMKREYRKCYWRAGFYRRLPWLHRIILRCICPDLKFAYKAS